MGNHGPGDTREQLFSAERPPYSWPRRPKNSAGASVLGTPGKG